MMFFKMVSCEALKPHVSEEVPIGNSINQLDMRANARNAADPVYFDGMV